MAHPSGSSRTLCGPFGVSIGGGFPSHSVDLPHDPECVLSKSSSHCPRRDFKKGGSTVTALALQKTYQGVTFWIAANEAIKPKVIEFLQLILQLLKNVDSVSRETKELQLLALIVPFSKERLVYYWTALNRDLPLCMERLQALEDSADVKPSSKELKILKKLLCGLPKLSTSMVDLVRECFDARKREFSAFETLAQLTVLPACHNKLYLAWRTPDTIENKVPISTASKIREAITSKMNSNIRSELRRQIDGRYAKMAAQYDSVTGTSSSIQADRRMQPPASISEDGEDSSYASVCPRIFARESRSTLSTSKQV